MQRVKAHWAEFWFFLGLQWSGGCRVWDLSPGLAWSCARTQCRRSRGWWKRQVRWRWWVMVEVLGTLWDTVRFGDLAGHLIVLGEVLRGVWTGGTRETWEVVDAG